MLKRLVTIVTDWMLYTSLFAACCTVALCMATERLLLGGLPEAFSALHIFVFGATLLVYNTHYVVKRAAPQVSDRVSWSQRNIYWHYTFFLAGFFSCIGSLFFLSWQILEACVLLGMLSFAYSLPLLPFARRKRIKDFGWIKITVLTGVWTIVTSVLPILYWQRNIADYPYEVLMRFVFMFTLCVAFDIRDMQTDLDADIYTLPNLIGLRNSYLLMDTTMLLFALLGVVQYLRYPSPARLLGELFAVLLTKGAILYTQKHPSDKAYLGYVDGMMLVYGVLCMIY
jgi:1,4-dihydroxy-2-naphthoate octaprenyltransferase